MFEDGEISFWDVFREITASLEPDGATRAADSRTEYAADVRPLVVNQASTVIVKGRALHFG